MKTLLRLSIAAGAIIAATGISSAATFNVVSFGANGGDAADDTAAFQQAINAASGNGELLIPAGRYIISQTLNVTNDLRIRGSRAEYVGS